MLTRELIRESRQIVRTVDIYVLQGKANDFNEHSRHTRAIILSARIARYSCGTKIRLKLEGSLRDYPEVYSDMKVQLMRGLVGNMVLIIAKTAVIASLLELPYTVT
ncbi:PREDICTED: uncharacterized protein LOC105455923 [Wasmannia auropunctata]|uniref:uncharacterized protein LOC105455923 n=1 Tax=Wasmannia auropunctata TaxID=64793 RepID=UPI0005EE7F3D|nr:PREDICTED: uncharacterized protein LOC105455923 [Wasmannia auropunctata]